jgi:hypothetical protein
LVRGAARRAAAWVLFGNTRSFPRWRSRSSISLRPTALRTWLSSDGLMTSTGFRRDLLHRGYCRARQAASRPGPKPDRAHLFRRHDSRGGIATRRACVHAGDDASAAQCARTAGLGHRIRLVLRADGGQRDPLRATLIRYHFAKEGRLPRGFRLKRLVDLPMAWPDQWRTLSSPRRRRKEDPPLLVGQVSRFERPRAVRNRARWTCTRQQPWKRKFAARDFRRHARPMSRADCCRRKQQECRAIL